VLLKIPQVYVQLIFGEENSKLI